MIINYIFLIIKSHFYIFFLTNAESMLDCQRLTTDTLTIKIVFISKVIVIGIYKC